MYTAGEIKSIIDTHIQNLSLPEGFPGLYDPVRYIMELGGKRIRPLLTMMSANIFSEDVRNAISPALAMEVFHNFTLVHDDIMDAAPLRRGAATVHTRWDHSTAILSGDVMLIKAYELLSAGELKMTAQLLEIFNKTAREVCEGQRMDMDFESEKNVSAERYVEMIRLKTSVLLGCCAYTGAIAGGAAVKDAEALYHFGESLGISFQIQDDILDTWGDASTFGKQKGGDIIRNKKTFLLLKTLELCKDQDRAQLNNLLLETNMPEDEKVQKVIAFYEKYGVRKIAEELMQTYFNAAMQSLKKVEVNELKKQNLSDLAQAIYTRSY